MSSRLDLLSQLKRKKRINSETSNYFAIDVLLEKRIWAFGVRDHFGLYMMFAGLKLRQLSIQLFEDEGSHDKEGGDTGEV